MVFRYFYWHYPTMLDWRRRRNRRSRRSKRRNIWRMKYQIKNIYFILLITHFCFHPNQLGLILDYFSSVCPWSWLSKVVATDTLHFWKHLNFLSFFFFKFLDKMFLALLEDFLHIHWKCRKFFEKCWALFLLKSNKHFFDKCLALVNWALLSTFEHLKYDIFRKLSTFKQQIFLTKKCSALFNALTITCSWC